MYLGGVFFVSSHHVLKMGLAHFTPTSDRSPCSPPAASLPASQQSPSREPLNPHPPRTPRDLIFEAESPDEAALVYGVRSFDYFLCNRVVSATCERVDVRIGGVVDMYEVAALLMWRHAVRPLAEPRKCKLRGLSSGLRPGFFLRKVTHTPTPRRGCYVQEKGAEHF